MSAIALLGLAGLALVDSTSIGTLVLPIVLLLAPRVHVGRFLVYLATVAGFYALVGLGLVTGAGWLLDSGAGLGEVRALRWAELVIGGTLLVLGIFGDPRGWFGRARAAAPSRAGRWHERLVGPHASYRVVVGVGLLAALVEVGSMLPFLAGVGIISSADLPFAGEVVVVAAYVVVMVLPALVLLGARLLAGRRLDTPLARLSGWIDRHLGNAGYWAAAIVGLLLLQDARVALGLG
ncbi:GAP family protein [Nocardioides hwasunensis]